MSRDLEKIRVSVRQPINRPKTEARPEDAPASSNLNDLLAVLQRDLLEAGPPTCIVDGRGDIVYSNQAFAKISEALNAVGALPGYRPPTHGAETGGLSPSTETQEFQIKVGDRSAYYRRQERTFGAESERHGVVAYIFEPITKQKTHSAALLQATTRLDDITRMVSDWVWETDRDLVITFVSPRITEALGYHPLEIVGIPLDDLPSTPNDELRKLIEADTRSPFRGIEIEVNDKDGLRHSLRLNGLPVYSPQDGKFQGLRGTAADVTNLRAREEALVKARDGAEMANRTKTEFLANMSHELRTPLNAIIGFSEIMESELLGALGNAQYKGYAGDIHESAEHLLKLINDILDVAKVEAGGHSLHEETVDPVVICESVVRLVAERSKMAGQSLDLRLPTDLPLLRVDSLKIKQVLLNLVSNAIKFTPRDGAIEIEARVDRNGDFTLQVSDTGIGIAQNDMERAFAPFEQVDNRINRNYEGTGLGLPISKAFMELHGGNLILDSEPGVGTKAIARLPASRVLPAE